MLPFVAYFFLVSILLSVAAHSSVLRESRLGRWWKSRGVRLLVAAAGIAAGLILAGTGFARLDWVDIFVGLVVAAVFTRDVMAIRGPAHSRTARK